MQSSKARRKELSQLHKSTEYLKMMEVKVGVFDEIETEEKEEEQRRMTDKYLEEKGRVQLKAQMQRNEELRLQIDKLKTANAEHEREVARSEQTLAEEQARPQHLSFDKLEQSHQELQRDVTELRVTKSKLSRLAATPEEQARDSATDSIQEIYEMSASLGLPVDKVANDTYAAICTQADKKKQATGSLRSTSTGRSYLPQKSTYSQPQEIRRNNFIVKRDSAAKTSTSGTLVGSTKAAVKHLNLKDTKPTEASNHASQESGPSKQRVKVSNQSPSESHEIRPLKPDGDHAQGSERKALQLDEKSEHNDSKKEAQKQIERKEEKEKEIVHPPKGDHKGEIVKNSPKESPPDASNKTSNREAHIKDKAPPKEDPKISTVEKPVAQAKERPAAPTKVKDPHLDPLTIELRRRPL